VGLNDRFMIDMHLIRMDWIGYSVIGKGRSHKSEILCATCHNRTSFLWEMVIVVYDASCYFVDVPRTTPSSRHKLANGTGSGDVL